MEPAPPLTPFLSGNPCWPVCMLQKDKGHQASEEGHRVQGWAGESVVGNGPVLPPRPLEAALVAFEISWATLSDADAHSWLCTQGHSCQRLGEPR